MEHVDDRAGRPIVFIRQAEVLRRTALSRSTLYELMAKGQFPRPMKLGKRMNCWPEDEVQAWMRGCIEARAKGQAA